ncbi:MAG: CoA activase [Methanopyri archaeon]|nr:CoA activase [Methanopyri archaeon]
MRVLGVDAGSTYLKCVDMDDEDVVDAVQVPVKGTAHETLERALERLGAREDEFDAVVVTGYGREALEDVADEVVPELPAVALGATHIEDGVRTVIDVGGQDTKVMKVDVDGNIVDFQVNDKCAAGTGRFIENVADRLDINPSSINHDVSPVKINSMCAVFAESEVVSLLHRGVEKDRIMMGVYEAVAERVAVLAERVDPEPEVVLVGGMVKQPVFADVLGRKLGMEVKTPGLAWCAGAIGAALRFIRSAR